VSASTDVVLERIVRAAALIDKGLQHITIEPIAQVGDRPSPKAGQATALPDDRWRISIADSPAGHTSVYYDACGKDLGQAADRLLEKVIVEIRTKHAHFVNEAARLSAAARAAVGSEVIEQ
jgi:hypothetical protein